MQLEHFRLPFDAVDAQRLNIAQDMVIDNLIHRQIPGWRNWEGYVKVVNAKLKEENMPLAELTVEADEKGSILSQTDEEVYAYLGSIEAPPPEEKRIDQHSWGGEDPSAGDDESAQAAGQDSPGQSSEAPSQKQDQGEAGEGSGQPAEEGGEGDGTGKPGESSDKPAKDPFSGSELEKKIGEWAAKAGLEASASKDRSLAGQTGNGYGNDLINQIAEGREYDLFTVLRRYIKKISAKHRTNTWKKFSRKQPDMRPGSILKKQPGEIFIVTDTSGSMHQILRDYGKQVYFALYSALNRVGRVYGVPGRIFKGELDTALRKIEYVKTVEELRNVQLGQGGSTDYRPLFDNVIMNWGRFASGPGKKWSLAEKPKEKFPDLIIFLTDLDAGLDFLKDRKYNTISDRLLWIYMKSGKPDCVPPIGTVLPVVDRWGLNLRGGKNV